VVTDEELDQNRGHPGMKTKIAAYEAPVLTVLGKVEELTLGCDKHEGGSDGFTFHGQAISCTSP
jgi:hypothetical protein